MAASPESIASLRSPLAAARLRAFQPLALWHLLSLDAPTVATVWTWFLARCSAVSIGAFELTGMFLAVWILYAADRLLDANTSNAPPPGRTGDLQPRHHFHVLHRRRFGAGLALAGAGLAVCLTRFPRGELALYLALAALLALWFAAVHWAARQKSLTLPKELVVGLFFAAAISVPAIPVPASPVPAIAQPSHPLLPVLAAAISFGLLCALNGLFIHLWENRPIHPAQPQRNSTDPLTRRLLNHLQPAALLCFLLPLAVSAFEPCPRALPQYTVSLSALALLILHHRRHNFEPTTLRALADLVLLSPLLLVPLLA